MNSAARTNQGGNSVVAYERPELLLFCGIVALIGNIAPLVLITVAVPIAEHDFVADTVSDLARGPHKWIMDTGFYLNAAGLLALSIAAAHAHLGRMGWSAGLILLSLIALVVVMLGLWDELHTAPSDPEALTVHTRLTFLLGPMYLAGPLLMASAAKRVSDWLSIAFVCSAVLWAVFVTGFKLVPDSYDGLLEKVALAATLLWTLPLSLLFLNRGRHALTARS